MGTAVLLKDPLEYRKQNYGFDLPFSFRKVFRDEGFIKDMTIQLHGFVKCLHIWTRARLP